jgi:MoxR-like ATPase
VLLEGPTGIGKSELVRQTADELGIGFAVLDLSLLEPPDLVGCQSSTTAAPSGRSRRHCRRAAPVFSFWRS